MQAELSRSVEVILVGCSNIVDSTLVFVGVGGRKGRGGGKNLQSSCFSV